MAEPTGAEGGALPEDQCIRYGTPQGRWVMLAMILGSSVALLDGTVVNVALPVIGQDFDANVSGLQWTLNGYLLALASLILLGGSLGDRFGRRRVFLVGVVWFGLASLLCGLAVSMPMLIAARILQGIGGALMTPGSLAILQATFHPADRGRAIGAWSGLSGIATAIGPFVGGYLIAAFSWRYIFLINLPVVALIVPIALRHVPETSDPTSARQLDFAGAVAGALGLAGATFALIEGPERGATSLSVLAAAVMGLGALAAFVLIEERSRHPMVPLDIFSSGQFVWANVVTVTIYAALGSVFFLLVLQLQQVLGYTPLQAGMAALPVTVLLLLLSARAGALSSRIGPRLPMTAGPLISAVGIALMIRITAGAGYIATVLPAVTVFGIGLALTVAPLTTTVLAAAESRHAGVASGVNNAVARAAQLLAVAVLPVLAGITGDAYTNPEVFASGFRTAVLIAAGLLAGGGAVAWFTISNDVGRVEPAAASRPQGLRCEFQAPTLRTAVRQ
ncbi:MAG: DHA2 family efflux MFS transporter permease subunit [Nitriliruptorales bacterium]|nr:DHA2 family efflux MFS transporter permease subunit [Nitriliruptorales bacterium]